MGEPQATSYKQIFDESLLAPVSAAVKGRVRQGVSAATLTTFRVGGLIRALVTVESLEELMQVQALLFDAQQPVRVIGNGSNLLISDCGLNAWIIRLGAGFKTSERSRLNEFEVGAAALLMPFARRVSDDGYSGLEFAAGIPASIGGAVFMNAGAHGAEIGERVVRVHGVLPNGVERVWQRDELVWSYRFSGLPSGATITSVVFSLTAGDPVAIAKSCSDHLAERRTRQPLALPSAGSVFKNPSPEQPAGKLLEQAGLKGYRIGGAQVSELHANWIVNPGKGASAADIANLIQLCRERVSESSGIELEPEVKIWF